METVFVIFGLGVMVSLCVAKGVMQANEYANGELERQKLVVRNQEKQP